MAEKKKPLKHLEVDGVEFDYDEAALDDMRVVIAIGHVADESLDPQEKIVWFSRLSELLFSSPWDVMNALAEKSGGRVTPDGYNAFFTKALEAMQVKN